MAQGNQKYKVPQVHSRPTEAEWNARQDICFSGGAIGSDYYWSWKAEKMGHGVRAFSFDGHQFTGPDYWRHPLHKDNLLAALPKVKLAGVKLRREGALSANSYVKNLLCRNYYQVAIVDRCYAIGVIRPDGIVDGGTAWACQMFIDRFHGEECPCYIYDLNQKWWYKWDGFAWTACFTMPPPPEGHYAGIGTRKFNDWGRKAIDDLYNQK